MICVKEVPENDPLKSAEQKTIIDQAIAENKERPGAVMLVLNEVQGKVGHVSPFMQVYIAKSLNVPLGQVHGVVTFYSFFKTSHAASTRSSFVWEQPVMSPVSLN